MWNQVQQALNESTVRVIKQVANLLPGVAALIVALATQDYSPGFLPLCSVNCYAESISMSG